MNKGKMVMLVSAIIIEIAAVILIAKAIATDSSATEGIIALVMGSALLVALTRKPKDAKTDAK